jgi:histidine triad (HIT) family protein
MQQWINRFDDAQRRWRTLYAAERRLTCLYERLAPFRLSLELIALLDRIHADEDASDQEEKFDYQTLLDEMGMVDSDFFVKNAFVEFLPVNDQRWLNVQDPHVIEDLRRRLAPWLRDAGFDDFDFSDLVARERKVTQRIASLAIDAGLNGIVYLSRMHPGERCWALFEGTTLRPDAKDFPSRRMTRISTESSRFSGCDSRRSSVHPHASARGAYRPAVWCMATIEAALLRHESNAMSANLREECIFCAIVAGTTPASVVYEDPQILAFMDVRPVTPGHLLIIPKAHARYLADLDEETGARIFTVGMRLAAALRAAPEIRCEGVNVFLADGEAAFQEVFHTHLHVFPRFEGDSFRITADWSVKPEREELDAIAALIKAVMPDSIGS